MTIQEKKAAWLASTRVSEEEKAILRGMDEASIADAFYKEAEFGTGGMRGLLGPGTNRLNDLTVGRVSVGYAQYCLSVDPLHGKERGIVISHDNRFHSREFAELCAKIFNKMGIKAYLFDMLRPTPELSFAVREKGAIGGVMVTASHNPKEYNGYKVYDETGCQLVPEEADKLLAFINALPDELHFEIPEDKVPGETIILEPQIDDDYCKAVEACQLHPELDKKGFKVIYSPQHGASLESALRVFQDCGYEIIPVKEQCPHDPNFGGTKSPNPEVAAAWELCLEYAKRENADVCVMTDPDGDRCGIAYLSSKGTYERFNGNQSGALLIDYLFAERQKKGLLPKDGRLYDTIVTSSLGRVIAESYGVKSESFLTGFKFIGNAIARRESKGEDPAFCFGYEESYGCLIAPFVRDKDGVQAILLYTEMALFYKRQGIPLDIAWENLQKKYGYHLTVTRDAYFEGVDGAEKMKNMMAMLHAAPFEEVAGINVEKSADYLALEFTYADGKKEAIEGLPKSDVMKYFLVDGSTLCVRPSGTEPKVKFYIEAVNKDGKGLEKKVDEIEAFIRLKAGL